MIERIFGNFEGKVDPAKDEMHIRGIRFGWKAAYSIDELPSKIAFYERLIRSVEKKGLSENVHYSDTLKCLRWAQKVLADE